MYAYRVDGSERICCVRSKTYLQLKESVVSEAVNYPTHHSKRPQEESLILAWQIYSAVVVLKRSCGSHPSRKKTKFSQHFGSVLISESIQPRRRLDRTEKESEGTPCELVISLANAAAISGNKYFTLCTKGINTPSR